MPGKKKKVKRKIKKGTLGSGTLEFTAEKIRKAKARRKRILENI